jgi:hypothetical protein
MLKSNYLFLICQVVVIQPFHWFAIRWECASSRFYPDTICDVKTNYNIPELQRIPLWTAASSEGQYCALDRTFAWCTSGTILEEIFINDTQLWDSTPKGSASDGNCVAMSLKTDESSVQLSLAACSDSKSYMCQVLKIIFLNSAVLIIHLNSQYARLVLVPKSAPKM